MGSGTVLRVVAALFIGGGIVRILADRRIFRIFRIADLWVDKPYFIYVYKVLGAFVILTGLVLWSVSEETNRSRSILRAEKTGLVLVGLIMAGTGQALRLPLLYYGPDFAFCLAVAFLLHRMEARALPEDRG
jgi:hypothetical protein